MLHSHNHQIGDIALLSHSKNRNNNEHFDQIS
nr:MAG TPA: hypothetical protein [Caudoviricetes sp.]